MPPKSKNMHAETIKHLWDIGIRNASEIKQRTNIPTSTIYYNIVKLKKTGSIAHKKRQGRPKKITAESSRAIAQFVRRNPSVSSRTLANKLFKKGVK
ncbi:25571_t:CDS:1, partial [Dentiscutata erythropus]